MADRKRVIIYARVSTAEQGDSGISLDAQVGRCRQYAKLYDLHVEQTCREVGSGKDLNRYSLRSSLDCIRAGEADGLLIAKLDRLSRSVGDWDGLIRDYFGPDGCATLYSVSDQIDTSSASGRLVLHVLMAVSQWEREAIGERTREALAEKKRRGERVGRIPFGYRLAEGSVLVEDAEQQAWIREMRGWRDGGASFGQVAEWMNERAVRTNSGGIWHGSSVRAVLGRESA